MKIGFIGLGIMGKPMAINLAKKGYDLQVYDLNAANVGAVAAAGAAACASVAGACAGADVIITMLPNSPQVEDVVLSPVSYTHLDVYKRQPSGSAPRCCRPSGGPARSI